MPEKNSAIVTYAAASSLAAVALIYVFAPTFFLDDDPSASTRKKGIVGLTNNANDCFINSVLQALAGLPDLRIYLIRETHRRRLDGAEVYEVDPERLSLEKQPVKPWKLEGLQKGTVTYALKDVLDALNERPIYKKTISPQPFIRALERAFNTRISRQQQDAQELLQIVTERVCDEYHAGSKARKQAQKLGITVTNGDTASGRLEIAQQFGGAAPGEAQDGTSEPKTDGPVEESNNDEEKFPFEGEMTSQIECLTCRYKSKPHVSTFVTLTLNVPQQSSTSLNACFDGMLKVEHIDDFICDYCRLEHALESKTKDLARASTQELRDALESDMSKLRTALKEDPEHPPKGVELPDTKFAPRRSIAKHMFISSFPKVLAVHLSRSMYAVGSISTKNLAKVNFPETLPLGGILDQKKYRLLSIVCHKGSHNSGHYETFRRQVQAAPYSTPHSFGAGGVYSIQNSPNPSAVQSPRISTSNLVNGNGRDSPAVPSHNTDSPSTRSFSSQSSLGSTFGTSRRPAPTSAPRDDESVKEKASIYSSSLKPKSIRSLKAKATSATDLSKFRRKPKPQSNRWWRISDDKVKESKTSEVLGMQKEVYLLFYELDRRVDNDL